MRQRREGFSLVEMMVAMFVIAIAIIMFSYFLTPLRQTSQSQIETQAVAQAKTFLDSLRSSWGDPQNQCAYRNMIRPQLANFPNYVLTVTSGLDNSAIMAFDSATNTLTGNATDTTLLRNVNLTITSGFQTITLTTQVARPGAGLTQGCS
jgi:prepilin-type N-terminal cleavage/methylation domain-containing protein